MTELLTPAYLQRPAGGTPPRRGATLTGPLVLASGVALGVATSVVTILRDVQAGPTWTTAIHPLAAFLSSGLNSFWAWALFPFFVGWAVAQPRLALIAGTTGMLAAVTAYYATDALSAGLAVEVSSIVWWSTLALLGAPAAVLAGRAARRISVR